MSGHGFMQRALDLAARGRFSVSPNPMVGCVIEEGGTILGEGFHRKAGEPHAEVEALQRCKGELKSATAWVTLEPCTHHGRTPPCVEALIERGIGSVVVATEDPSPPMRGKGITKLLDAGVRVTVGPFGAEARKLNEMFFHSVLHHRPFLLLKAGMTLDGKLATVSRASRWITSSEARQRSLELREEFDAILIGSGTVVADDPNLTRRLSMNDSVTPWRRVVLDARGVIPPDARLFSDGNPTILFTSNPSELGHAGNVEIVHVESEQGRIDLRAVLAALDERGVRSVIAEGGSLIHSEIIRRKLWQKMVLFIAPTIVGGNAAPSIFSDEGIAELTAAHHFRFDRVEPIGRDLMVTIYPE